MLHATFYLSAQSNDKKGVNLSCASPASAAVCTILERRSMVQAVDIYRRNPRGARASSRPFRK
ncbi:hypothetical protein MA16_Dca027723 [Dendrobium catenatum]|uniref:Uncharacterized protein n=1 Tax=Dendrobium catenatum TaxID=906689 RepID=A0A2I0VB96_9ASPA|nr:hypothetical protein MA16_Dca027723 [Dendrobium catenatum]